ncbi:MAG: HAMP domain-containing protein [Anaerolineae bacterium]|nr:HAMP domain-containing protein [Anaerolineae bacterium]
MLVLRRAPLTSIALAFALALGLAALWLRAPGADLRALALYLALSTGLSLALAALVFRWSRFAPALRLKVTLAYLLGVAVTLANIAVTAHLMFLSAHDLSLLTLLLVFSALLSLGFGLALAQSISQAARQVSQAAHRVAQGDLTARATVEGHDELAQLAADFNAMADRLAQAMREREQMERSRRELIAAVSHDLRTPLASIRALVEALADGMVDDPRMAERYLATIRGQTASLSRLIDDLFDLAQLDAGALRLHLEPTSLSDLISDTLESMQAQAQTKGVHLTGEVQPAVDPVLIAPDKVQRVLYNLVQNALRHTPPDGSVYLTARVVEDAVQVDVVDTGEGIPSEDLPHVFEPFYRAEKSRSRDHGGAGLGLAIARGIVEAHGGRLWVASQPGTGASFSFTLPLAVRPSKRG